MKKNQKGKQNKIETASQDESHKIQKKLDEREQILILQFQMVQATLEWAASRLDNAVKKHKNLKKMGGFQNEEKIEELEDQIRFLVRRIELEQRLGTECQKKEFKLKKDKENFIVSQLGKRLSGIFLPPDAI